MCKNVNIAQKSNIKLDAHPMGIIILKLASHKIYDIVQTI
jgi:hypothetical protein